MDISVRDKWLYAFGSFVLDPMRHVLTLRGVPVPLTPKAFDALLYFVENPGRVISKDELLSVLWPARVVEESNISQTIFTLRKALTGTGEEERFIVTAPGRGYRFAAPVRLEPWKPTAVPEALAARPRRAAFPAPARILAALVLVAAVTGAGVSAWWWAGRSASTDDAAVILVTFQNDADDTAFDRVLGKALEIDLAQSPFLKILSESQIQDTLGLMLRAKDEKLTPETAREVCARNQGRAVIDGTIAALGTKYLLTLAATDCVSGKAIDEEKEEVAGKEEVVGALDRLTGRIRAKLGESDDSLAKFAAPLLAEKTASFDALKAYSEARSLYEHGKRAESIEMFQHAIELDPNFVMAYADLSAVYGSMHENKLDVANITKAYELRDTVNERQKFFIVARYHRSVTKDLNETVRTYRLWTETYPRDSSAWANLASTETWMGQYGPAIEAARNGLALSPGVENTHVILARALLHAGALDEARKVCEQSVDKGIAGEDTRGLLMQIGYAQHDDALMSQQVEWAKGKTGERAMRAETALIAFSQGKVKQGLRLFDEMAELGKQQGLHDYTAAARARSIIDFGLEDQARQILAGLPQDSDSMDYLFALAEVGDEARAEEILRQDLSASPTDTLLNDLFAPQVRAALALRHGHGADAVAALRPATPYELRVFDAVYLRGLAYLAAGDGAGAAGEFQKILNNQGIDPVSPLYPLSRLGLARADGLKNDFAAAKREYESFFAAWKDADPDVPILIQARQDYSAIVQKTAASH
jgi:DNA-binding winged helix-turn-helix (wHTH) protein/tetratricopeptide (TPR) repeat protein